MKLFPKQQFYRPDNLKQYVVKRLSLMLFILLLLITASMLIPLSSVLGSQLGMHTGIFARLPSKPASIPPNSLPEVLAESDTASSSASSSPRVNFNIVTNFKDDVFIDGQLVVQGKGIFPAGIEAPNVVYSINAGNGIRLAGDGQNVTIESDAVTSLGGQTGAIDLVGGNGITIDGLNISNTGVTSIGGKTGDVSLVAGTGITISGNTISASTDTSSDTGSAQNIFKTIGVSGQSSIVADSNTDTLNFAQGSGITLTTNATTKTVTITSSAILTDSGFTDDGTIVRLTDPTDSVGIGTSAPLSKFSVGTNSEFQVSSAGAIAAATGITSSGTVTLSSLAGSSKLLRVDATGALQVVTDGAAGSFLGTDGAGNYTFSSPAGAGDITAVGSITNGAAFADSSASGQWLGLGASAGRVEFNDTATDTVNIMSANVGIGTTAPGYKLEVNGDIKVGDGYTMLLGAAASDPSSGPDGALYYRTSDQRFRCKENGAWKYCDTSATGPLSGSGANGQVSYFTAASAITGSNLFFWDSALNRLGIGTSTPGYDLDVVGNIHASGTGSFGGLTTSNQAGLTLNPYGSSTGNTGEIQFGELSANGTNYVGFKAPDSVSTNAVWTLPSSDGSNNYVLTTNGSGTLSWNSLAGVGSLTGSGTTNTIPRFTSGSTLGDSGITDDGTVLGWTRDISFTSATPNIAITNAETLTISDGTNTLFSLADAGTAGDLSGLRNFTANGTVTFGALGTGIAHVSSTGVISSSAVNLASADITGTLAIGNGGTGVTGTPTNGQLLIGNGSGYTLATLTNGAGVSITNGSGTITVTNTGVTTATGTTNQVNVNATSGAVVFSLPQSIDTNASVRFNTLGLNSSGTNTGQIQFTELASNGTNYVGFKAPSSLSTNTVWTLPSSDGSSNYVLTTDGAGTTSWASVSGVGALSGSGTTNTIPRFSNGSNLTNSGLTDDGSVIGITRDISFTASTPNIAITNTETLTISDGTNTLLSLADGGTAGNLTGLGNLTANGTITFGGLSTGIGHFNSSGVLTSSAVNLASADITGTLGVSNGGTGLNSNATNGQLLIGNNAGGYTLATLTAGSGIGVTNGNGTITIANTGVLTATGTTNQVNVNATSGAVVFSLPQSIDTNATVRFNNLGLNSSGTNTGEVRFNELTTNGSEYVGFKAPSSLSTNTVWTLPSADGSSNYVLTTDGAGTTSWASVSGIGGLSGSGTTNTIPRFTNGSTLGDSGLTDDGSVIGITRDISFTASSPNIAITNTETLTITDGTNTLLSLADGGTAGNLTGLKNLTANGTITFGGLSTGIGHFDSSGVLTSSAVNLASADVTGTLAVGNGGTGLSSNTTNGQLLIGNNAGGYTLATLAAGTGIGVTNGNGAITIANTGVITATGTTNQVNVNATSGAVIFSLPQSIDTNANVRFNTLGLNSSGTNTGEVQFTELASNGSNYVGFKAPSNLTADTVWTLPSADGSNNYVLSTNGSGILSWISQSGGISGSGTTNTIPRFTNGSTLGDSGLTDDGSVIGITRDISFTASSPNIAITNGETLTITDGTNTLLTLADGGTAGNLTGLKNLTANGTITFGGLSTGIGHFDSSGVLTSSAVNLASADITGTLAVGNGGTGISSSTTNGQLLIGNNAGGYTLATLTAGTGIGITNGDGSISIANTGVLTATGTTNQVNVNATSGAVVFSLPQSIDTNASVRFNTLGLNSSGTNTGEVRFNELSSNGTNYTGFKGASNLTANTVWTLPSADGSTGYFLQTDGSGALSWSSIGGAGGLTGSGTTNTIPRFTSGTTLGDSGLTDDGSVIGISRDISFTASSPNIAITNTETLTITDGTNTLFSLADGGTAGNLTGLGNLTANGTITFGGLSTGIAHINGSGVVSSSAVNLASADVTGTLAVGNGGTGISSSATNGQLLIGNNAGGYTLATLTAGSGIGVTNGNGSITIANTGVLTATGTTNQVNVNATSGAVVFSLPQSIDTNASVRFNTLGLNSSGTNTGEVRFNELTTNGSEYVGFKAASSLSTNTVWTLPSADGSNNYVLTTNGAGVTSWASVSGIGGLSGSGTTNTIPRFTNGTTLGDSGLTDDGSLIGISRDISFTASSPNIAITNTETLTITDGTNTLFSLADGGTAGNLTGLKNLTANGTITFGGLSTGIGHFNSSGVLTSSAVNLASADVTGTLAVGNGGTGISSSTTNGQLLIGNNAGGYTLATLTAGTGIGITNGNGAITIANTGVLTATGTTNQVNVNATSGAVIFSLPQSIDTNASVRFNTLGLNSSGTNTGEVRFNELASNGTNYTGFKASSSLTANTIWTLPAADGGSGYLLQTDGNGVLSWNTVSGAGGLSGSGTNNFVSKFTSSTSLGNSLLYDDGTYVGIGTSTPNTSLDVNGNIQARAQGEIRFADSDSSNYVGFKSAASLSTNTVWTLPSADGSNNYVLSTDGSGVLSWASVSGVGALSGSGTTNTIPRFTSGNSIGDSGLTDNGSVIGITRDISFTASTPNIAITNAETLTVNDGTNTLLSLADNGTTGTLTVNNISSAQVNFTEAPANGSNFVALKSPSNLTADTTYTLPAADGSNNYVLSTNGSGTLSWVSQSGGISGSGTTNTIPRFTSGTSIGDSGLTDDGSVIGISRDISFTASTPNIAINNTETFTITDGSNTLFSLADGGTAGNLTGLKNFTANGTITFGGLSTGIAHIDSSGVVTSSAVNLASADVTGTLAVGNGGTGLSSNTTNGQLLIGNNAGGYTLATITAGTGIGVTNGNGAITIANTGVLTATGTTNQVNINATSGAVVFSLPQSIDTNATVRFNTIGLNSSGTNTGEVRFNELASNGSNYVGFKAASNLTADTIWTLPAADGLSNYVLTTNGAGVTSWQSTSGIGGVSGTGATNYLAKWNGTSSQTISQVFDDGTSVGIGTSTPASLLSVGSSSQFQVNSSGAIAAATGITSSGTITFSGLSTGIGHLNSSGVLTSSAVNLASADITGTLAVGNGGTGLASNTTNGQLLIGNNAGGYTLATLTAGTGIGITNGNGAITLANTGVLTATGTSNQVNVSATSGAVVFSLPQSIDTNASVRFNTLGLNSSGTNTGEIRFNELSSNGTNYTGFKAASNLTANTIWTLPSADGSSNYVLTTNGTGTTSWQSVSGIGGISGNGTSNYISKFNGTSSLTNSMVYDSGTNVGIGTSTPGSTLDILGSTGITFRTNGSSSGFSIFDRSDVPGDQMVFQGNAGNYSLFNVATKNATQGSEKLGAIALWPVDITAAGGSTQLQIANNPTYGGQIFTLTYGGTTRKLSLGANWSGSSAITQMVLDTNGRVGIGNGSPSSLFSVGSSSQFQVDSSGAVAAATGITSSGTVTFSGLGAGIGHFSSGGVLTSSRVNLASSDITNTLGVTNGGTGISSATTNGQLLIGNNSGGYTLATLTGTTNQVNVANGSGSITLSLPQSIDTNASVSFNTLALNSSGTNTGEARFNELASNGTNYTGFKAASNLTANTVWTLPSSDGGSNYTLTTDGAGVLSWTPTGSGLGGSGTTNTIPRFSNGSNLTNSGLTDDGTVIGITRDISFTASTPNIAITNAETLTITDGTNTLLSLADGGTAGNLTGLKNFTANGTITFGGLSTGIGHLDSSGVLTSSAVNLANSDVTGTLAIGNGGTGISSSTTNGQLLIGNNAGGYTLATLTAGTGIGITNGNGAITLANTGVITATGTTNQVNVSATSGAVVFSLPQSIDTNATVRFNTLGLNSSGTNTGEVRFNELASNGTNYVGFKGASNLTANTIWTLPSADGSSNYVLTTNGAGTTSWQSVSGIGGINGNGSSNYISKFNGTSSLTNSQIYDDGTNVGIGTSIAASDKLEVAGGIRLTGTGQVIRSAATTGQATYLDLLASDAGTTTTNSNGAGLRLEDYSVSGDGRITFYTNEGFVGSSERMRITNNGKVGVGTTNPLALFSVGASSEFQVSSTGDITSLKGVSYTWPSSQGTSDTYLKNNGSGGLSWSTLPAGLTGTGAANQIAYWSSSSNLTYDSNLYWNNTSTRLGIGTSSPSQSIESTGDIQLVGANRSIRSSPTSGYLTQLDLVAADKGTVYNSNGAGIRIESFSGSADGRIMFNTNQGGVGPAERLRINNNGFVGVATTNPSALFSVGSSSQFQVNSTGAIAAATGITSSGTITFSGLGAGIGHLSSGGVLTSSRVDLTSSDITNTLGITNGGTGISSATTNGQLLIGNNSGGYTLATLTGTTNQVNVTNGSGSITLSLPQSIDTNATVRFNTLGLNSSGTNTGEVRFNELSSNGTNYTGFKAASNLTANTVWTLPSADGSSNYVLTTDGAGTTSWASVSGVGGLTGSGTTNTIPRFSNGSNLTNSGLTDDGSVIGISRDISFTASTPSIAITNAETLTITDGTNTLLSLADGGTAGNLTGLKNFTANGTITFGGLSTGIGHLDSSGVLTSSAVNLANSDVTGTLGIGNGGTGISSATTNGQLLIGNNAGGYTLATLTAGTGIGITNGNGAITIANTGVITATGTTNQVNVNATSGAVVFSLPQSIDTNATVRFNVLGLNSSGTNTGEVRFNELSSNGTNYTGFKAASNLTANTVWTLPSADGSSNYVLTTDGAGTTSWSSVSGLGGVTGSGTTNTIPRFSNGSNLTNSGLTDDGTVIGITRDISFTASTPSIAITNAEVFTITDGTNTLLRLADGGTSGNLSNIGSLTANGAITFGNFTTGIAHFDPSGLMSSSAVNLANSDVTGTLTIGKGGTGLASTPTNGQLLIGNGTDYTLAAITAGAGIGVTNGAGSITLANTGVLTATGTTNQVNVNATSGAVVFSLPQSIDTNASVSFNNLSLNSSGTNTGEARFNELTTNGSNYVGLKGPSSLSTNTVWTLPSADGSSNYVLTTNGSGTMSWQSVAGVGAISSLNGLTGSVQLFATGTSGTDFNISSSSTTHTFNIPDASSTARGLVTTGTQTFAGAKTFSSTPTFSSMTPGSIFFAGAGGLLSEDNANFFYDGTNDRLGLGNSAPTTRLDLTGLTLNTDADGANGMANFTNTITKNDTLTRSYNGVNIKPTINTGGSNTNTTFNVLNVDTTNTGVTGLTTNLLSLNSGGTNRLVVTSGGQLGVGTSVPGTLASGAQVVISASNTTAALQAYNSNNSQILYNMTLSSGAAQFRMYNGSASETIRFNANTNDSYINAGNLGIGNAAPGTKLDLTGLTISTDADLKVGAANFTTTIAKNDTNTRQFYGLKIKPVLNTGATNTTTTFNVLDVDTTNTTVTGLTTNLLRLAYGGTSRLTVNSSGNLLVAPSAANGIQLDPYSTSAGNTSELRFQELAANGTQYSGFKASDNLTASTVWTLPVADGSTSQVLTTDGAGVLSWSTASGGSVSGNGTATRIAFWSSASNLTSSSSLYWDNTNSYLGLGTSTPATRLDVAGLTLNTDVTSTVGMANFTGSVVKNSTLTKQFYGIKLKPTFNTGATNANTTYNAIDVDTTNTTVTGLTTNLLSLAYGGTQRLLVGSAGDLTATATTTTTQGFAFNANSNTTSTAFGVSANLLFRGTGFSTSSSSTVMSGVLGLFSSTGNSTNVNGRVLKVENTGASSAATTLMVSNAGTGLGLRVNDDGSDTDSTPFVVDASGNVGIGNTAPAAKLDITGNSLNSDADQAVSMQNITGTVNKNSTLTRQFYGIKIKPTFNTGATNANTTYNVIDLDTTNTTTTGLTTNLLKLAYGGTQRLLVGSAGNMYATATSSTTQAFSFGADSVTTSTALGITANALTTGNGLSVSSNSTNYTTGNIASIDWSPGTAVTATGDLLRLNVGTNGTLGNLLNLVSSGSSIFSVSQSAFSTSLPTNFTAAGDTAVSYDLAFMNQTASSIKSNAPLTIDVGDSWESNDLTLTNYNSGNFYFMNGTNTRAQLTGAGNLGIGVTSPTYRTSIVDTQNTSSVASFVNLSSSTNTTTNVLRLAVGSAASSTNPRFAIFYAAATGDSNGTAVGHINLNNSAVNYATTGADYGEYFAFAEPVDFGDIVAVTAGGVLKSDGNSTQLLGVVSDSTGFTGNSPEGTGADDQAPVGLMGQIRTKLDTSNGPIKKGDFITASAVNRGVGAKSNGTGFIIGQALEDFNGPGIARVKIFVSSSYADTSKATSMLTLDANGYVTTPKLKADKISLGTGGFDLETLVNTQSNQLTQQASTISSLSTAQSTVQTNVDSRMAKIENDIATMSASLAQVNGADVTKVASLEAGLTSLEARTTTLEDTVASLSAKLNDLALNGGTASGSGALATDSATLDTLTVTGNTLVNNLGVTGTISAGNLMIEGLDSLSESSINTLGGTLKLQSLATNNIEFEAGKIVMDTTGNVKIAGELTTKKVNIDTTDVLSASAGKGTILAGTTVVTINTTAVKPQSLVFVTATTKTGAVLSVSNQVANTSFKVNIPAAQAADVTFNWWIVDAVQP